MNTANIDGEREFHGPVCFHCYKQIDAACETVIDCAGEEFCSTLCATLVVRFDHDEGCTFCEAELTLPCGAASGRPIYYRGGVAA